MDSNKLDSIYGIVNGSFDSKKKEASLIAPVILAYVGDTVYDLFIRSYLISTTDNTVNRLHTMASKLVCSAAQAKAFYIIENMLTEDEIRIYKRGRNAHSAVPKNSSCADYRTATGLETLIGYLYLSGNDERIGELMKVILNKNENSKVKERKDNV